MRRAATLPLALALTLASCDAGPSGPGTLDATVSGPPEMGAVVVEVVGRGIEGFEAQGSTRVYGGRVPGFEPRHRVVLINETPGEARFGVRMRDVSDDAPSIFVVSAADGANEPLATGSIEARVEPPS